MKTEIEMKVKEYFQAKQVAEEAKAIADALGNELKEILVQEGITKETTSNGYDVSLVDRKTFKYDDELAIRDYLRLNNLNEYLVESIDTKRLNESLKKSNELYNDLVKYITPGVTTSLSVKENK